MINYVVCVVSPTCFDENQYITKQKRGSEKERSYYKVRRPTEGFVFERLEELNDVSSGFF